MINELAIKTTALGFRIPRLSAGPSISAKIPRRPLAKRSRPYGLKQKCPVGPPGRRNGREDAAKVDQPAEWRERKGSRVRHGSRLRLRLGRTHSHVHTRLDIYFLHADIGNYRATVIRKWFSFHYFNKKKKKKKHGDFDASFPRRHVSRVRRYRRWTLADNGVPCPSERVIMCIRNDVVASSSRVRKSKPEIRKR